MDQMSKMQVVAKKMEKMLETSLQQLKAEQTLRKEAEEKSETLELKLTELAVQADEAEAGYRREVEEKDEKIINLEASIEYLQQALIQKEEDLMKKEEIITKLRKRIDIFNTDSKVGIDAVNKFEKRLSQLMSGEESSKKKKAVSSPSKSKYLTSTDLDSVKNLENRLNNLIEDGKNSSSASSPSALKRKSGSHLEESVIEITPVKRQKEPGPKESFEEGFHGFGPNDIDAPYDAATPNKSVEVSPTHITGNTFGDEENNDEIIIDDSNITTQDLDDTWDEDGFPPETRVDWDPLATVAKDETLKDEDDDIEEKHFPEENMVEVGNIKHKTHCKVCKKTFLNRESLRVHEEKTGHAFKFPCDLCGKRFKQKIQMKRHQEQVHSDEQPFQCNRCDRKFKNEFSWKRHQENDEIHEKLANWTPFISCNICGKQFERRRKWCLDQHMLTHEENKRFQCHICEKWFRSSGYLTQHMKACSGLKEEECAFCGKRFAKKSVLLNHERLHTGDKPFQCRICDERFRTHHNYSNHGKNAHGAQNATHYNELQNAAEEEKKFDTKF